MIVAISPVTGQGNFMSIVGRIRLEKSSKVPLQHQLKRHIQFLIFCGELREGDRLPSHRDLASAVGVNRNTVSQVYAELERESWLLGKLGSGTYVHAAEHVKDREWSGLVKIVDEAIAGAAELGFREEDVLRALQGRLRLRAIGEEDAAIPGREVAHRSYL